MWDDILIVACLVFHWDCIGVLESYNYNKTGKLISLSEQYIVDCYSNNTCQGGNPELAAIYIHNHGVHLESDYPYTAGQDRCRNLTKSPVKIDFKTADYTSNVHKDLKSGLRKYGPLSVCLYVSANWRFYSSGVWYNQECSPYSNHCVLLVGYGRENGNNYWLFKNSWGLNWGQDGYIKVIRDKHKDYCGIEYGLFVIGNEESDQKNSNASKEDNNVLQK